MMAATLRMAAFLAAGVIALAVPVSADDTRPFPAIYTAMLDAPALVTGGNGAATWAADGASLWYAAPGSIRLVDARSGKALLTLDEARLRDAMKAAFGDAAHKTPLPLETMRREADGRISLRWGGVAGSLDTATYRIALPDGAKPVPQGSFLRYLFMYPGFPNPDPVSPDGRKVATVQADGNLAVRAIDSAAFTPITSDAAERFGWDIESRRISLGALRAAPTTAWSPDSTRLFAMRIDRRETPHMPEFVLLKDPLPEVVQRDVFPAGGPYYRFLPAIVDVTSGRQVPVKMDFGTDFVLFLAWADDGRTAYLSRLDRRFSRLDVVAVDAATGAAHTILSERDPRGGLRTPHAIYYAGNVGFSLLPGGKGFLWLSERDGWNHIYHHDANGKLVRRLTSGPWRVENIAEVDVARGEVFFTARPDRTNFYDAHVMKVPLAGGRVTQLTEGRGTHDQPLFSPDRTMFVDRFESFNVPPRVEVRAASGERLAVVDEADASRLVATGWKPPLEFTVKDATGTDIHGVMYRPFDFDPKRRYPIIEYVYGGPQAIWSYPVFVAPGEAVGANIPLALAQLGYVVVKFDTAGTPGRSRDFQIAVTEKWGPGIAADHAAVIRALAARHDWIDGGKVGIFGHSWGGFNVLHALAAEGDVYKAGIASAPGIGLPAVPDGFMENYLGSPKDNPEAWTRSNAMRVVTDIKAPLMLVSGTQDYLIYIATLRVSDALIKAGVQHEVALAPGQGHGIYGAYEKYLTEKEVRFFLRHLPPEPAR